MEKLSPNKNQDTLSREQTYHSYRVLALVSAKLMPMTINTINPGWSTQPGLKSPVQRLQWQAFAGGDI